MPGSVWAEAVRCRMQPPDSWPNVLVMPRSRRRGGRSSSTLALFLGLLVAGLVATTLAVREAHDTTRERDDRLVDLVRSEVSARLEGSVASLRGTSGLAIDGQVTEQEFAAMAAEVVPGSAYSALAYSEIVRGDDVGAWEAATGISIKDTDGRGGFQPTSSRPEHLVVRYLYPVSDETSSVIGFDLASDPVRAAGAERSIASGAPAFIGPINLASSGSPGLFVIQAVRDERGTPIGFVASGIDVSSTMSTVESLPNAASVAIDVEGRALRGITGAGSMRVFEVGGLEFRVWADDARDGDPKLAIVLGLGTLLLAGTAQVVRRREQAFHLRQAELLRRQTAVAALGQQLAAAPDSAAVIEIASAATRSIVDATDAHLAVVDTSDRGKLVVHRGDQGADDEVASSYSAALVDRTPLADSVRRNQVVAVHDRSLYADWFPETLADAERAGTHAVLAVPLRFSGGGAFGALGFSWDHPVADLSDDTTVATTISELVARALERSLVAEAVRDRSAQLSNLSQDLARAQLPSEVFDAIEAWVPPIVGAVTASIRRSDDTVGTGDDPDGPDAERTLDIDLGVMIHRHRQQLHVVWERDGDRSPVVESVLRTIARLADAALGRTEVHQHEHELVEELQAALLGHDTPSDHLDVAVRYEPAVSLLGMGGDFYDAIRGDRDDFLVVGDVTGHGPSAVASMAELKTLTRHLLMRGDDLAEVCAQLDDLLMRQGSFATMAIVAVDRDAEVIRHLSAGHPYPLLRCGGTWTAVSEGRRSLLGVAPDVAVVPSTHRFAAGDAVVLFTDGLVEERRTPLHESIEHVRRLVTGWPQGSAADLADRIVAQQTTERQPSRTDDDIAVLVAVHR